MVARVMKKSRVKKLLEEDTSTVFDFFSTKCNLRKIRKWKRQKKTAAYGHLEIVKYFVEERNITDAVKIVLSAGATKFGRPDCLKYLVEEAKLPPEYCEYIAYARYYEHAECLNYLQEKGFPEPTDGEYADFVEIMKAEAEEEHSD